MQVRTQMSNVNSNRTPQKDIITPGNYRPGNVKMTPARRTNLGPTANSRLILLRKIPETMEGEK